jgi:hypothetical protein
VSNVFGRAKQEPPGINWELRVNYPLLWVILNWQADAALCVVVEVTRNLMLDVGTTQEQYDTWIEMEMTEFLILLQCRG